MRPPDENQTTSKRPPFMSAGRRPASSEDNILARLEREGRRGKGGWKQSWIAWCSVASVAIIGLIGVLASLARENMEVHRPAAAAAPRVAPDPYVGQHTSVASMNGGFAPLPPAATLPKQPAKVIDMSFERTFIRADNAPRPPLVTLKPEPVPESVATAAASVPMRTIAVRPVPAKHLAAKPAATARKMAAANAAKAPPARPVVAAVVRPKKTAPAAAPEPAVDSDVALLSAIILHASRHAGERAQMEAARCGAGKQCAPSPDPLTSLQATD